MFFSERNAPYTGTAAEMGTVDGSNSNGRLSISLLHTKTSGRSGRGPSGTLTKATPPNPKNAEHHHPRCTPLSGTSRCSARQFWLAEHRIRPYRGLRGTLTCSANFGLGLGSYSRHPHAGSRLPWRRSQASLAQVPGFLGAGVFLGGGPAPQIGLLRPPVAQVPTHFPHLRQTPQTPAPNTLDTCAKNRHHLRQLSCFPVAKWVFAKMPHGRAGSTRQVGCCGAPLADISAIGAPQP